VRIISGGPGYDAIRGAGGDDTILLKDGEVDQGATGAAGNDTVTIDCGLDPAPREAETVRC